MWWKHWKVGIKNKWARPPKGSYRKHNKCFISTQASYITEGLLTWEKNQALILNGKHVNIFYIFCLYLNAGGTLRLEGAKWNLLACCASATLSRLSPWTKLISGDNCQQLHKYFYGDGLQRILPPLLLFLGAAQGGGDAASHFQNPENSIEKKAYTFGSFIH